MAVLGLGLVVVVLLVVVVVGDRSEFLLHDTPGGAIEDWHGLFSEAFFFLGGGNGGFEAKKVVVMLGSIYSI